MRAQLIQEVVRYKPFKAVGVPECRVLMLGQVGAGKSSFFNTVNSVFRGYVTAQAGSGSAQHSLTSAVSVTCLSILISYKLYIKVNNKRELLNILLNAASFRKLSA